MQLNEFFIILTFILLLCKEKYYSIRNIKCTNIAHACGSINYIKYSNSLEAFNKSYSNGYRFIEIDLLVTDDGHIFGAHDWDTFKSFTNYSINYTINYNYLRTKKILNEYHIIYDEMLYTLLRKYKNVNIVTDKINDYNLLKKYGKELDRFYVEVFSIKQYFRSKHLGFNNVMLHIKDYIELIGILDNNKLIEAITIGPKIFYKYKNLLVKLYRLNIRIFVFLVSNTNDIKSAYCKYVNGFYID